MEGNWRGKIGLRVREGASRKGVDVVKRAIERNEADMLANGKTKKKEKEESKQKKDSQKQYWIKRVRE